MQCITATLFGAFPVLLVGLMVYGVEIAGPHASDFWTFWHAGRAVIHGQSPYPSLHSLPRRASEKTFAPFVYPPIAAIWMTPLAVLPYAVAKFVFLAVNLAAAALALRLLGVTDWRCYGVVYGSAPVFAAVRMGTVSLLLMLAVAAAWRYRDRLAVVATLIGSAIAAKLFLWPLWLWLVRTRRYETAVWTAVVSLVAVAGSWAAIAFVGLREYPQLLGRLTDLVGPHSYSLYALGRSLGAAGRPAQATVYLAGAVALAVSAFLFKDDRRVLVAALAVSLILTPILWPHYLVLLFVPIALARRTLSPLWIAPLLLWVVSAAWNHGVLWIVGSLGIATVIVCAALWRRPVGIRMSFRSAALASE